MKQLSLENFFRMTRTTKIQMTFDNSYLLNVSQIEVFIKLTYC